MTTYAGRLDVSFLDIQKRVANFLGLGDVSTMSTTNLTLVQDIIYRAYRQFLYPVHPRNGRPHNWSFLKYRYTLTTEQNKVRYTMPPDFERMVGNPQYGEQQPYPELVRVPLDRIMQRRAFARTQAYPQEYALVPVSADVDTGSMWEIYVWPNPNGTYLITFTYISSPVKPIQDTDQFVGGPRVGETLMEMALAVAEQQEENTLGIHSQLSDKMLNQMILSDNIDAPDTVGKARLYGTENIFIRGFVQVPEREIYSMERS
jgi:hypothetical protein